MLYNKKTLSLDEQLVQLKQRGLIINDENLAAHYLKLVGYYRLSGFWWPLLFDKTNHVFKPNSNFETVAAIYSFDKELRLLIFSVLESIEIAFRAKLIYHLSREISPWWFEDSANFINIQKHYCCTGVHYTGIKTL